MLRVLKTRDSVRKQVLDERRRLIEGAHLAMVQWQYGLINEKCHHHALSELLERRYMFLYETAKQRKIHALE